MAKRINFRDRVVDGELDLSMSELQEVPVRDIALATKGTSLDLSNNKLISLGKNFPILTHLVKLDLSKNQIVQLPSNFGDLVLLKHLDLYSNKLNHLPLSFGRLKNLNWLDLKDNPLVPDLLAIAGPCQDSQQCQTCAKKVVQVLAESERRAEEARERQEAEQKRKDMAEKAAQKKEQPKNKKNKQNEGKKKNAENGVKVPQKQQQKNQQPKRKDNIKSKARPNAQSPSTFRNLISKLTWAVIFFSIILFFIYTFDKETYKKVLTQLEVGQNITKSVIPAQVVTWSEQTSTFLNTDPRVKAHWLNVCDVAAAARNRVADGLHAVSLVLPVYWEDAKRFYEKTFNSTTTQT